MGDVEPGSLHHSHQTVERPEVGRGHGMIERLVALAGEENDQQPAARGDAPRELGEGCLHLGSIRVDQRVPGEDAAERFAAYSEGVRLPETVALLGARRTRSFDELWYGVDTCDLLTSAAQPVRPLPRAAYAATARCNRLLLLKSRLDHGIEVSGRSRKEDGFGTARRSVHDMSI